MSFLLNQQKTLDRTPSDITDLRSLLASQLGERGIGGLSIQDLLGDENFMEQVINPLRESFGATRNRSLAQASESVGNLTGSSLGNTIGRAAGESSLQENALLGQLLLGAAEGEANRFTNFLGLFSTAGVGPPENVTQPGLINELIAGAGGVGRAVASQGRG